MSNTDLRQQILNLIAASESKTITKSELVAQLGSGPHYGCRPPRGAVRARALPQGDHRQQLPHFCPMSAQVETIISCNGNSAACEGNDWSADARHKSASEQRRDAKRHRGWHRVGNLDFCPACWSLRRTSVAGNVNRRKREAGE